MAASRDLGEFIRELRKNARISLRQLADQAGVSNPYLSQIERGLRKPSAEVLQQLANALRVSTPLMYLRAGLLAEREDQGVVAAIAADPDLTDRHKKTLIEIYEAFRRENARTGAPTPEPGTEHPDTKSTPEPDARSVPDTETASEVASGANGQAAATKAATRVSQSSRNGRASRAPRGDGARKSAGKAARKAETGGVDQPATRPKKEMS
jgi:transcriptional regulator with XRE-family HTH domain